MKKIAALLLGICLLITSFATADGIISYTNYTEWYGECISRQVSLYSEMSVRSNRIRYIQNGQTFRILERSDDGNWVHAVFVNDRGTEEEGWVDANYIIENPIHIVLRNASGVYAYADPFHTNKRVGTLSRYDRFTVIETIGNYYLVSFRNAVAYLPINADYWVEENLTSILNGPSTTYTTRTSKVPVLAYPNDRGGTVTTYNKNVEVQVYYTVGNFAAIGYNNVLAFINLNNLTQVYESTIH